MLKTASRLTASEFIALMRAEIEPLRENFSSADIELDGTDTNTVVSFSGALARGDAFDMFQVIYADWNTVKVGRERLVFGRQMGIAKHTRLAGMVTMPSGLTFLAGQIHEDYEAPVYAIVYHDGQQFRGHIPMSGNTFNPRTVAAFGNHLEEDVEAYLELYASPPLPKGKAKDELAQDIHQGDCPPVRIDEQAIIADLDRTFVIA